MVSADLNRCYCSDCQQQKALSLGVLHFNLGNQCWGSASPSWRLGTELAEHAIFAWPPHGWRLLASTVALKSGGTARQLRSPLLVQGDASFSVSSLFHLPRLGVKKDASFWRRSWAPRCQTDWNTCNSCSERARRLKLPPSSTSLL